MAPPAGALVATVGDLSAAIAQFVERLEEQKRWTQSEFDALRQKMSDRTEQVDSTLKGLNTNVEGLLVDVAELKKTRVTITDFKQQVTNLEMKAETANGALEAMIKKTREDGVRDLNAAIQGITNKCEATDAGVTSLREQVHIIDTDTIPDLRKALDDERTKRRAEDLRLERADESLRESCDRRVDDAIALLRKDIETSSKKLHDEMATKDNIDAINRDIAALRSLFGGQLSAADDAIASLREVLNTFREATGASFDKTGKDITTLMKDMSTAQADLQTLTHNTNTDFLKVRESLREQVQQLQRDLSDARAAAAQGAVNNEKNIQAVASDVTPLKEAKSLLFDRLKIKDVAGLVREWQAGHVPTTIAGMSDLENRVGRLKQDLQTEHDLLQELLRSTTQIRGHFKRFHDIATGLDAAADMSGPDATKLPPIPGMSGPGVV